MTLQAGTPIGKYVVRRKIAEGGMAEIYLAAARGPEGFEKDVVIKRIRSFMSNDEGFVQMFISEARLASRLNHANIVQIFDFDKHEDSFYIAMEYVRGRSLRDVRQKCREQMRSIPPTLVAHIGVEVARALHYAHQLRDKGRPVNLVHRDVTPHNVLLSWEGAVKLTDFGIAKGSNKLTAPGMLKGKFAYMSPEQARGDDVDARTDIFALGIVLWEMLTGGRLFEGDSDIAVLRSVQQSAIPPPGRLNPDVPQELDAVVMRALERNAAARFQTAQELERALGQFILRNAKSVDDTDLGGFLQRLYADELGDERFDRTASGVRAPSPEELARDAASVSATSEPVPARREPTAVMPGRTRSRPELQATSKSADDDAFADTHVLQRGAAVLPSASAPSVPVAAESAPALVTTPPKVDLPASYAVKGGEGTSVSKVRSGPEGTGPAGDHGRAGQSVVVSPEALTPSPSRAGPAASAISFTGTSRGPTSPSTGSPAAAPVVGPSSTQAPSPQDSTAALQRQLRRSSLRRVLVGAGAVALLGVAGAIGFFAGERDEGTAGETSSSSSAKPSESDAPGGIANASDAPDARSAQTTAAAGTSLGEAAVVDAGAVAHVTPDAGAARPVEAAVVPAQAADAGVSSPAPAVARARGTLVVNATPWANVYIDGKSRGEVSGTREFAVAAGKYVVRFAHPKKSVEKVVTVREGRRQSVDFDLFRD